MFMVVGGFPLLGSWLLVTVTGRWFGCGFGWGFGCGFLVWFGTLGWFLLAGSWFCGTWGWVVLRWMDDGGLGLYG